MKGRSEESMLNKIKTIACKSIQYEKSFVIAVIFFGILYSVILTPNTVFDEVRHYVSAYRYSNVLLFQKFSLENGNFLMRSEDAKILEYSEFYGKEMIKKVKEDFWTRSEGKEYVECDYEYYGNFIQYIPQTLGLTLGRILGLGHLPVFYLGRLFNLLAYTALMVLCIRKIPFGKMVMVLIGLLPICIHQAASLNYDAVLNASSFCFIAYIFYLAYSENEIKKGDLIMTAMFAAILGAYKGGVYVFLCGLLFIIPKKRLENRKRWFLVVAGVIGSFLIMVIMLNLWRIRAVVVEGGTSIYDQKPLYEATYFLEQPFQYVLLLWNSIREKAGYYVTSAFGGWLGGHVVIRIPYVYIWEYVVLLVAAAFYREPEKKGSIKGYQKGWFLAIMVSLIAAIAFVFMVAWTPQGSDVICGMQGRYFTPFLPLVFYLFRNKKFHYKINVDRVLFVYGCILELLVLGIVYIQVLYAGDALRNMNM